MESQRTQIEERVDVVISWLLRLGVILCALIILGGWTVSIARSAASGSSNLPQLAQGGLLPDSAVTHSLAGIQEGLARGSARAWIGVGLMLLIALPIVRVAFMVILFGVERDWPFALLTLFVLVLLLSGLLLGKAV